MKSLVILTTTLLLNACASTDITNAACDGLHVRPANPNGSILNPAVGDPSLTSRGAAPQQGAEGHLPAETFGSCQGPT